MGQKEFVSLAEEQVFEPSKPFTGIELSIMNNARNVGDNASNLFVGRSFKVTLKDFSFEGSTGQAMRIDRNEFRKDEPFWSKSIHFRPCSPAMFGIKSLWVSSICESHFQDSLDIVVRMAKHGKMREIDLFFSDDHHSVSIAGILDLNLILLIGRMMPMVHVVVGHNGVLLSLVPLFSVSLSWRNRFPDRAQSA